MKVFESIKEKDIDELAKFLDKYGTIEDAPWMDWWNENYCSKCDTVMCFIPYFEKEVECCWCEANNDKCRFFNDMDKAPNTEQIIKLWLESDLVNDDLVNHDLANET